MKRYLIAFLLYIYCSLPCLALSWIEFDYTDREGKERHAGTPFLYATSIATLKSRSIVILGYDGSPSIERDILYDYLNLYWASRYSSEPIVKKTEKTVELCARNIQWEIYNDND